MKFITLASLAMATVAVGQSLADLPSCALPCLNDAVKQSTTCSATDVACICKKFDAIQGAAAGCILKACGQDVALNKVLPATQKLCANAGSGSGTGKPEPTTAQQPTSTGTVAPVPEPTEEPTPTTGSPTSPPVVTAGAAAFAPMGGLAMLAAAVLAL
ncbi:extracellular membrane protein, CFEM domain-containing protein [Pochonia chlamydosporia 170]|uniref:Extracellular membrane protein, CFEM domain-containing protein n=1 Tax=Pochonia chlamydosporia 170 TaxID=1380566 RepID=A0A179G4B1_METCM|nr:extracellular membrane protein, CFEM domain-containing protein [Pochonia chlamydosporia 170]OAQ71979.1 extracellular membrane protein, CFEM domain-containing protein [Pochonia chlamydosporia 170]